MATSPASRKWPSSASAQRLARAISCDDVTAPVRDRIDAWVQSPAHRSTGAAQRLAEFVRCPVCTGFWLSLATSAAWPRQRRWRRGLSVAGVQVLLTIVERLVSEQGRAAIHHADITASQSAEPNGDRPELAADRLS
ncbi:MAG: DUF1360 domain-containing protein [Acidimicrobiia bacterium]|nr:DUF1360 domain-containing protein [Acidimicrobiia bacterium]